MHEFNVTEKLFQVALENAQLSDQERIKRLKITLDPDSGYLPDAIRFYFEHLAKGTPAEGAILDFELVTDSQRIALNSLDIELDGKLPETSNAVVRRHLAVTGVVQGVGFRPFLHLLARQTHIVGWVRNTTAGVELEIQGAEDDAGHFIHHLRHDGPPLARIFSIQTTPIPFVPEQPPIFEIRPSHNDGGRTLISPDVATCPRCLSEIFDPADRRFGYPFTNCTHCGPRFTIIEQLPYDRPLTTMAGFPLCPACEAEYRQPEDRRFHAQPVACSTCGPMVRYESSRQANNGAGNSDDYHQIEDCWGNIALQATAHCLKGEGIVAIKGIGGFHLACLADSAAAIARLRLRKSRPHQPLALMVPNLQEARAWCHISTTEEELLLSQEAPIVLLRKRPNSPHQATFEMVAPQNGYLGLMLPYTPLHHLLLQMVGAPLVITSGNYHNEPLCIDDEEARRQLSSFCDGFLLHNRPIAHRCDDSVVFHLNLPAENADSQLSMSQPVRRSRGLAPLPVLLPEMLAVETPLVVAGADLKNVSALVDGQQVFLTPHIGNLSHPLARLEQTKVLSTFEQLFNIEPQAVVCDLHPDYASQRYARQRAEQANLPLIEVQHHHAHIAACLAENNVTDLAIGLSFDGTGYGTDGHIWGGEVLVADCKDFERAYHLEYLPLPGGDAATKHPERIAAAYLKTLLPQEPLQSRLPNLPADDLKTIVSMLNQSLNVPLTSSMGRLFDAVSALLGLCSTVTYEGQAAIALEAAALDSQVDGPIYPFDLVQGQIKLAALFAQILADMDAGHQPDYIARRFHLTIAEMTVIVAKATQKEFGTAQHPLTTVALSGGVWQNRLLLELSIPRLQAVGFRVLLHHAVPANDGGLTYGQAVVAAAQLAEQQINHKK